VETFDLNPVGRVFFPDMIPALVKRYSFQKFPKEYGELDEQKGVEFLEGKWGEITVERFIVYQNGILVDTRSSTADSEKILEEALLWSASEFGLAYRPGMIKRKAYVSSLTFYSEIPLLSGLNDALSKLSARIGNATSQVIGHPLSFETVGITMSHEWPQVAGRPIAAFTINRRIETPFSENKYFSEAPLPTDLHITLLQEFENELLSTLPATRPTP
jgi:hypothetical protein